jgi:Ca-activated chloride channel family protein
VTGVGLSHGALAGPLAGVVAAALVLLAAGRFAARRRRARLLGRSAPRDPRRRDALLAAALAAAALALLGPHAGERTVRVPATGVDVVLLVDVSASMLARDAPPSRLERARSLAGEVLARLGPGDRAALAAFAGEGVLLTPLTPDHAALAELAPALDESLLSEQGSRLDAGVRAAVAAYRPESPRPRVLLVLSDGEDPEGGDPGLPAVAAAGVRVVVVAFGSEAGAAIPLRGTPLRDAHGAPVATRSDPARLRALAEPTGGALLRGDRFGAVDPEQVVAAVRRDAARARDGLVERRVPRSATLALTALAFALALAAAWPERRAPRDAAALVPVPRADRGRAAPPRPADRRGPGRRAGAMRRRLRVGAAALAPALALSGGAGSEGREAGALEARVRREPESAAALVELGLARAREGAAEEAERAFFAAAVRSRDPDAAALAWYDLGVAALERGDAARARDAFFDALALAPGDREAQFNLEWALRALDAREAGEGPGSAAPSPGPREGEPAPEGGSGDERDGRPEAGEGREPGPREPRVAPESAGGTPVQLSPDAAQQWLAAVEDDPSQALRAVAPEKRRGAGGRARGPRW